MIELKLDVDTLLEWQKHSHSSTNAPHYQDILDFIDCITQSTESRYTSHKRFTRSSQKFYGNVASNFDSGNNCIVCKTEIYPLILAQNLNHFLMKKNVSPQNQSHLFKLSIQWTYIK